MPKILIDEIDYTTPGAAGSYRNISVLVPGFVKDIPDADMLKKRKENIDENGIFEFTSYNDFEKTIGFADLSFTVDNDGANETTYKHYGNAMAYELLRLGYPVIYVPLQTLNSDGNIADTYTKLDAYNRLKDEEFWSQFRDKASYDFRFITHGLLDSGIDYGQKAAEEAAIAEALAVLTDIYDTIDEAYTANTTAKQRSTSSTVKTAVETAVKQLVATYVGNTEELTTTINEYFATDKAVEVLDVVSFVYAQLRTVVSNEKYKALLKKSRDSAVAYETYGDAVSALEAGRTALENSAFIINDANKCIADLATYDAEVVDATTGLHGRGDCVALIELDESSYINTNDTISSIAAGIEKIKNDIKKKNGKYCALTVPSVIYNIDRKEKHKVTKFPGAFHYLACFKNSIDSGYREWYAAAGYTRGVSSYSVKCTSVKLGEIAINALEPRTIDETVNKNRVKPLFACNVIANFRGSYYLWGNRTAEPLDDEDLTASSFLNIRQLCTTIKKQLYVSCRRFTFDPNSDTLWINFVNAIQPTLDEMRADQGIRDYKIVKVATDKKATLKARIRIIPIEAVEDFDIEISLEDSFGGTEVTATE